MASKRTVAKAIQHLRSSGCFNQHLEAEGAVTALVADWAAAFEDLDDAALLRAASAWLETPDGRRWPTKFDLREALKIADANRNRTREGCAACDRTGMREMVRERDEVRTRFVAACDCPKGHAIANPPPAPPNARIGDYRKFEPYHVVAEAWRNAGFTVLVATEDEPHFALAEIDHSEFTRDRLQRARAENRPAIGDLAAKLAEQRRMFR